VQVARAVRDFKPGGVIETGRPLDLAVEGEGFFRVILPGGEERYTRDGSFSLDQDGNVITAAGYKLEGIQLPPGFERVTVASDGTVQTEGPDGATDAGQITLYRFTNVNGLTAEGENLFPYGQAAGQIIPGNPGNAGFGVVRQGYLETANVDLAEELANLIEAQRAYGFDARAVRTVDDMWSVANNLRK
jgi:flagellar basal-body rod protein FlgG